jgi:hypothetical protein
MKYKYLKGSADYFNGHEDAASPNSPTALQNSPADAPNEAIANTAAAINFFIFYSPVFVYLHHRLRFNLRQDYCDKIICITGGNK